MVSSHSSN